jgi:hypothetical protein
MITLLAQYAGRRGNLARQGPGVEKITIVPLEISRNNPVIFNIKGNTYRLVVAR